MSSVKLRSALLFVRFPVVGHSDNSCFNNDCKNKSFHNILPIDSIQKYYETYYRSARMQLSYKFWTILNDLEVFGTLSNNFLGPSLSILVNLSQSGSILVYLALSWAILVFLSLCRKIPGYICLSLAILKYLQVICQPLTISAYIGSSLAISNYLGLSWAIFGLSQAISGYIWLSLAISSYLGLSRDT